MIIVRWIDRNREPQHPANPDFPDGIDIDLAHGAKNRCKIAVPYPAQRCGLYLLVCDSCGKTAVATTAGRRDDPRSVMLECHVPPISPFPI